MEASRASLHEWPIKIRTMRAVSNQTVKFVLLELPIYIWSTDYQLRDEFSLARRTYRVRGI